MAHLETGVKEIVRLVRDTYAPELEPEELKDFNSPELEEGPQDPNSPKTMEMPDTDTVFLYFVL